jgi:hypothetical protein
MRIPVIACFFILPFISCSSQNGNLINEKIKQASDTIVYAPISSVVSYQEMKKNIQSKKSILYKSSRSLPASQRIAQSKKLFIDHLADSIIPYWYGTAWDFNGITETPGQGKIACGYFITTTLRDMGYKINRYKIAQLASAGIIQSLVQKKNIKYYYNNSFEEFIDKIMQQGAGFYVVGLDNHVGYLYHDGNNLYFIHSTFVGKRCVMKEVAKSSDVLIASKFRITGKISDDELFLVKWMNRH